MAEYIVNPRRAPRAPARCRAAVVAASGPFDAETEDIGARGCQVVSPRNVKQGEALDLVITSEKIPEPLRAGGTVAWVSEQPPWRVGVAFHEAYVPSAERWFEKLAAVTPGMGSWRRVPERIALDAMVYLGPPPRFLVDFSPEEASLLRAIASGARLDELKARLRDRWPAAQRALFSLLARSAVTLSRGQSAHPDAWKRILTEVEASLAVESLGTPPPAPVERPRRVPTPVPVRALASPLPPPPPPPAGANPAASPWGTPSRSPLAATWATAEVEPTAATPALELEASPAQPRGAARAHPGAGWTTPGHPTARSGAGWRNAAQERGPEAQAKYVEALAEIENGNVTGAIALLREALAHSPGDAEIAAALGKLAFKDRLPGTR